MKNIFAVLALCTLISSVLFADSMSVWISTTPAQEAPTTAPATQPIALYTETDLIPLRETIVNLRAELQNLQNENRSLRGLISESVVATTQPLAETNETDIMKLRLKVAQLRAEAESLKATNEILRGGQSSRPTEVASSSMSSSNESNYSGASSSSSGRVQVKGYTKKDGTYVRPHTRSSPRR